MEEETWLQKTQTDTCTFKKTPPLQMSVTNNRTEADDGGDQIWLLIGMFVSIAELSL